MINKLFKWANAYKIFKWANPYKLFKWANNKVDTVCKMKSNTHNIDKCTHDFFLNKTFV